jgi:hypothetical protein
MEQDLKEMVQKQEEDEDGVPARIGNSKLRAKVPAAWGYDARTSSLTMLQCAVIAEEGGEDG